MALVELKNIQMHYGPHIVLQDFSMKVEPQESVAIIGASGSGKSTVLNILGLLLRPSSGERIHFGKKNLRLNSHRALLMLRHKISYLFQDYALIEEDTVEKNLKLALRYQRVPDSRARIGKALQDVGLADFEKRKVSSLSGGEQQRVALARILLKPSELILADEPTGNLDRGNAEIVMQHFAELKAQNKSIVMVTHDLSLTRYFDRVIEIA